MLQLIQKDGDQYRLSVEGRLFTGDTAESCADPVASTFQIPTYRLIVW